MWTRDDTQKLCAFIVLIVIFFSVVGLFTADLGEKFEDNGQFKEAVSVVSKSMQNPLHKHNADLWVARARNKRFLKDLTGAQEDINSALKMYTDHQGEWTTIYPSFISYKKIYFEMARIYAAQGKYDKALEVLKKDMKSSNTSDIHSLTAWVYEEMNQLQNAEEEHNLAVKTSLFENKSCKYDSDPEEVASHSRADFFWRQNRTEEAFRDYNSAIEASSDICPGAYYGRGSMYLEKKEPAKALEDLNKAIRNVSKENDDYFHARGLAYMDLKDYKNALADMDKALKINPQNADAKTAREECLKEIK